MRSLLSLLVCSAGVVLLAQPGYSPSQVAEGERLFRFSCMACHGADGDQVPGVDLGHGKFRHATTDDGLIEIIQKGIQGTAMPPHTFSRFEAQAVVAYLRSMATTGRDVTGNGDVGRGREVFEGKGGCASCHRVNGKGSRVGPDLSDIGTLRRAVEIERSILEPNEEVLPQNRYYRAVMRNGEIITGRILNQDTYSVQILDSKERLLSIKRSEVREGNFVNDSPMPSYRDKLSSAELADLVAYLVSLKGL